MKELKPVLSKLALIPNIDRGGCGIAALGIYNHIKYNYPNLKPKIVYLLDDFDIKYGTYDNPDKPNSAFHVAVQLKGKYIDSKGIRSKKQITKDYYETHSLIKVTPEYLESAIRKASWNKTFNRKKNRKELVSIFPSISHIL